MKRLYLFMATAALISLTGCHRNLHQLPGKWQGQHPVELNVDASYLATATMSMTFATPVTNDSPAGDVTLTALLDLQDVTLPTLDSAAMVNYALNVAGTATISGSWTEHDDDELILELDPRTLKVNIDPEGVTYSTAANGDGSQDPKVVALLPTVAAIVAGQVTPAIKAEFYRYSKIEDINIKDRLMTCEIGDKDYTFRQTMP